MFQENIIFLYIYKTYTSPVIDKLRKNKNKRIKNSASRSQMDKAIDTESSSVLLEVMEGAVMKRESTLCVQHGGLPTLRPLTPNCQVKPLLPGK